MSFYADSYVEEPACVSMQCSLNTCPDILRLTNKSFSNFDFPVLYRNSLMYSMYFVINYSLFATYIRFGTT